MSRKYVLAAGAAALGAAAMGRRGMGNTPSEEILRSSFGAGRGGTKIFLTYDRATGQYVVRSKFQDFYRSRKGLKPNSAKARAALKRAQDRFETTLLFTPGGTDWKAHGSRGRRGVKAGQKFVIVDTSVPGGRWVDNIIYNSTREADQEAAKLLRKGKRVQVIDAVWYGPAEARLRATGMRGQGRRGRKVLMEMKYGLPARGRRRGRRDARFVYSVTVPIDWVSDVSWHDARGYTADLFKHATIEEDEDREIAIVGFTSEGDAWEWQEEIEADPHAFGSSMSSEAFQPMRELWGQIV